MSCLSKIWTEILDQYSIAVETTEPHHPHQNPVERRIQTVKNKVMAIMDHTVSLMSCGYIVFTICGFTQPHHC